MRTPTVLSSIVSGCVTVPICRRQARCRPKLVQHAQTAIMPVLSSNVSGCEPVPSRLRQAHCRPKLGSAHRPAPHTDQLSTPIRSACRFSLHTNQLAYYSLFVQNCLNFLSMFCASRTQMSRKFCSKFSLYLRQTVTMDESCNANHVADSPDGKGCDHLSGFRLANKYSIFFLLCCCCSYCASSSSFTSVLVTAGANGWLS